MTAHPASAASSPAPTPRTRAELMSPPTQVSVDLESLQEGGRRLGRWLAYWALILVAAATAYVMAIVASDPDTTRVWLWASIGACCTLLVLVIPAIRTHLSERSAKARIAAAEAEKGFAERRAVEAEAVAAEAKELAVDLQARFNSSIGDVISPIASELANLTCQTDSQAPERRGAVLAQIVNAAVTLCGGEGVRATVYELGRTPAGKPGDLQRRLWNGRQDQPRLKFSRKRGDARERAVHDLVDNGIWDLQDDVLEMPEKSLYQRKHYRSFVAVAITAGGRPRGLLAVDAPEVGRFDRTHLGILLALAALAAIAMTAQEQRVDADEANGAG